MKSNKNTLPKTGITLYLNFSKHPFNFKKDSDIIRFKEENSLKKNCIQHFNKEILSNKLNNSKYLRTPTTFSEDDNYLSFANTTSTSTEWYFPKLSNGVELNSLNLKDVVQEVVTFKNEKFLILSTYSLNLKKNYKANTSKKENSLEIDYNQKLTKNVFLNRLINTNSKYLRTPTTFFENDDYLSFTSTTSSFTEWYFPKLSNVVELNSLNLKDVVQEVVTFKKENVKTIQKINERNTSSTDVSITVNTFNSFPKVVKYFTTVDEVNSTKT